jgi:hypothetical protein
MRERYRLLGITITILGGVGIILGLQMIGISSYYVACGLLGALAARWWGKND